MSITLKNITSGDTISSMVDKINYNFDQIILNGGGIEGPQGEEGQPGMQGYQGIQGIQGIQGVAGIRGTYFHRMPHIQVVNINSANPLPQYDSDNIEYLEYDIIISTKIENGVTKPVSLYRVIKDSNSNNLVVLYLCDFRIDELFNEFRNLHQHCSSNAETNNSLVRINPIDINNNKKRGLILNDYENITQDYIYEHGSGSGSGSGIHLIDDVIEHDVVLVCTNTQSSDDTNGSPHGGIVFYDWPECETYHSQLNSFPRINYKVSANSSSIDRKMLNITAPEQSISISAKRNIRISSKNNTIFFNLFDSFSSRTGLSVQGKDPKNPSAKTTKKYFSLNSTLVSNNPVKYNINNEIIVDKISIENFENPGANNNLKLLEIEQQEINGNWTCHIYLSRKAGTYIVADELISIGKAEDSNYNYNYIDPQNIVEYYNQSRIILTNTSGNINTEIIGNEIKIGKVLNDPCDNTNSFILKDYLTASGSTAIADADKSIDFGIFSKTNQLQLYSQNIIKEENAYKTYGKIDLDTHLRPVFRRQYADIKIDTSSEFEENISLVTSYPGVINMSNVTEYYDSYIINYTDDSIKNTTNPDADYTGGYNDIKICTAPMIFREGDSNTQYSHLNCYGDMGILNINNMATVHSGTIVFPGKKQPHLSARLYSTNRIIFNFTRIGNTVQCTFSGIIDTSSTCTRFIRNSDAAFNLVKIRKSTNSTTADYKYPSNSKYFSNNDFSYELDRNRHRYYTTWQRLTGNNVSNRLYLCLYPPVVKVTMEEDSNNIKYYKTNVKNLVGLLTCKVNNTYSYYDMTYNDTKSQLITDTITDGSSSQSTQNYVIPYITLNKSGIYANNTTTGSSGSISPTDTSNESDIITLPGSDRSKYITISGNFSYIIDTDEIHNSKSKHIRMYGLPMQRSGGSISNEIPQAEIPEDDPNLPQPHKPIDTTIVSSGSMHTNG